MGYSSTGRLSQTAYILRDTPERVKVTRRHHPLRGRDLEVLIQQGKTLLVVRLPDGSTMRIPRAWTDADGGGVPEGPAVTSVYTPESLRELIRLVDALRGRPPATSP